LAGRNWSLIASLLLVTVSVLPAVSVGRASAVTLTIPRGIEYYVPITLTNAQNSSTPAPFQQMIRVSSVAFSPYEAADLQNVEFFDTGGNIVPSWLESGNSKTALNTVYWLNLHAGINANSSVVVYMGFSSIATSDMGTVLTGEAPRLSSSYGQYDDGAAVFPMLYQNFAGTTCPSDWTCSGAALDDGVSLPYASYAFTVSAGYGNDTSQILDFYGSFPPATTGNNSGFGFVSGPSMSSVAWWQINTAFFSNGDAFGRDGFSPPSEYTDLLASGAHVYSIYWPSSGSVYYSFDYGDQESVSARSVCSPPGGCHLAIGGGAQGPQSTIGPFNWVRLRSYPPFGIMPSVAIGDVTPSDSVSVSCVPPYVLVGSASACTATVDGIGSPTGTISWGTSGLGTFSAASCSLSSGSCRTSYTPTDAASSGSAPTILATYSGDSNNPPNNWSFALLVGKANTSATVSCSPSEVEVDVPTTCTASIAGFSPSGVVTWSTGGEGSFSPSPSCTLSSGSCSVKYAASAPASRIAIIATYAGDTNNEGKSGTFLLSLASSASPSGGSIPEFPFQAAMASALVVLVATVYVAVRRDSKRRSPRAGTS